MSEITDNKKSNNLPNGWVLTTFSDISDEIAVGFASGKHNQEGIGFPHIRPMNISSTGKINLSTVKYVEEEKREPLKTGDVLFNNTNSPALLGKTTYITRDTNWMYSNHMTKIHPKPGISSGWLAHFLHHLFYKGYYKIHCRNHVNQASINRSYLSRQIEIPLAPLPEQRRIVEKIEELFTQLDAGVEALKRAQTRLKRYRASLLQAACEGRLVPTEAELACCENRAYEPAATLLARVLTERRRRWEEQEWQKLVEKAQQKAALARRKARGLPARAADLSEAEWRAVPEPEYAPYLPKNDQWKRKYVEPAAPDTAELPALPEGWVWASLPQLGELGRGKSKHRPRNDPKLYGNLYPFVQTGDIKQAEGIINQYSQMYSEEGLAQSKLWQKGTLCITIAANIGDTAILGFDACFPDSVVGFSANDMISIKYVEYFIRTVKNELDSNAPATAQKNINLETLQQIAIPLPPHQEQLRITNELDRLMSNLNQLSLSIDVSLNHSERLRQAILKKAFEGKLVPQDPSDEPAGALLARIKEKKTS